MRDLISSIVPTASIVFIGTVLLAGCGVDGHAIG